MSGRVKFLFRIFTVTALRVAFCTSVFLFSRCFYNIWLLSFIYRFQFNINHFPQVLAQLLKILKFLNWTS